MTFVRSIPDEKPIVTLEGAPKTIRARARGRRRRDPDPLRSHRRPRPARGAPRAPRWGARGAPGSRSSRRRDPRRQGGTRSPARPTSSSRRATSRSRSPSRRRTTTPSPAPSGARARLSRRAAGRLASRSRIASRACGKLRDHFVDSLAWRMEHPVPKVRSERKTMLADEGKTVDNDAELLDATVSEVFAGVRIPRSLAGAAPGADAEGARGDDAGSARRLAADAQGAREGEREDRPRRPTRSCAGSAKGRARSRRSSSPTSPTTWRAGARGARRRSAPAGRLRMDAGHGVLEAGRAVDE